MNELANTLRMYAGSNHYDDKCSDAMLEAADRLAELEDCDNICREIHKALDDVPYCGSYVQGVKFLKDRLAIEEANGKYWADTYQQWALTDLSSIRLKELSEERDNLNSVIAELEKERDTIAAQNEDMREAIELYFKQYPHMMKGYILDAINSPNLAEEVLKRRDAEIDLAADRLEVLEREHAEFFGRWHGERRMREKLVDDVERCYRMLLSEPNAKGALFKAGNILREALADAKASTFVPVRLSAGLEGWLIRRRK